MCTVLFRLHQSACLGLLEGGVLCFITPSLSGLLLHALPSG